MALGEERFVINDVTLAVASEILSPKMRSVLESGKYEALEARHIPKIMKKGDRLLELGGGVGYISSLASKAAPLADVLVIEADPRLCGVISENHRLNGVSGAVKNGVAAPPSVAQTQDRVSFYLRENFWGSSLSSDGKFVEELRVPCLDFQRLVDDFRPSIVICDIEGGETDLFPAIDLSSVDRIYLELHKSQTGLVEIRKLFNALGAQGFSYDPDYSVGAVVLFSR